MNYILETSQHETEVKKSKFITYLYPTDNEEDAKAFLASVKKQHPKANHHCSAMVIDEITRSNDDGEPAQTAGLPMLQVLLSQEMNHILAVVIRYFGGTLLGKGGLIRAYSDAVTQALNNAILYREEPIEIVTLTVPFDHMSVIETKLDNKATIQKRDYADRALFTLEVTDLTILDELNDLTFGNVQWIKRVKTTKLIPKNG